MVAILRALTLFGQQLTGKAVWLFCDNTHAVGCSLRKDGHEEVDAGLVDCSGQGDPATLAAAEGMSGVLNAGWRIRFLMVLLRRDAGVSRNSPGDGRRTSLVASIGRRDVARGRARICQLGASAISPEGVDDIYPLASWLVSK